MSKALLIKSQVDKNGGEVGKWNNFNNAPSYIDRGNRCPRPQL